MSCMDVVELEAVEALLHGLHAHRGSHFMDALVGQVLRTIRNTPPRWKAGWTIYIMRV